MVNNRVLILDRTNLTHSQEVSTTNNPNDDDDDDINMVYSL